MEIRDRIIHKSHELFLRYGVKSITMDDIAKPMGISKKTIYQFFKDKNELVHSVVNKILEVQQNTIKTIHATATDPIAEVLKLSDFIKETMQDMGMSVMYELEKYHPVTYLLIEEFKEKCVSDMIIKNLAKGIEMGLYRGDIDVNVLAKLRVQEIQMGFNSTLFPSSKYTVQQVQLELLNHFIYGICTLKGHKLINKYKHIEEE